MKLVPGATKDFGYLKIFDLYSEEELKDIWNEISHLDYILEVDVKPEDVDREVMSDNSVRELTRRARHADGTLKMTGDGLWVDNIYDNRDYSAILKHNRKVFTDKDIVKSFGETHPANKGTYYLVNKDATLVNRYCNTHKYFPHVDEAIFSAITILLYKPEKVRGGEFSFCDYDISFGCTHNSCIIFPSWVRHSVDSVECFENGRRYSIAQLMFVYS